MIIFTNFLHNRIHWFMYKNTLCFYTILLLLYTSFISASLPSTTILIRAPQTSFTEFFAYVDTESLKTYAQYQLNQIYKTPRPILLEDLLEKSQREFLSHEPQRAKKTYKQIISHIHSFDWTLPERKIIFYALFRMAQLETNFQKQTLFLQEAAVFSGDLKIDKTLFPPPLVQTYLKLKKSMNFISVNLKKIFPEHELVIINGKVYSTQQQKTLLLPYGVYRVQALSSSRQTWLKTLSLSRLLSQKIQSPALISKQSSCQQITFNKGIKKPNHSIQVLFPNFCVWNNIKEQIQSEDSSAIASIESGQLPGDLTEIKNLSEDLFQNQKQTNKWVKPVLWTGSVVLLSTLVFFIMKNSKKSSSDSNNNKNSPQVTVGF